VQIVFCPKFAVIAFSVALFALSSATAYADDPLARPSDAVARRHLEVGEAFYNQEKWDAAIVEFEKGALLAPNLPVWFLALGQAHRQAGRYDRARWYYERFLSSVEGNEAANDAVAMVRKFIDDMNSAQNREPTEAAPTRVPAAAVPPVVERDSGLTTQRKWALGLAGSGALSLGIGLAFGIRANGLEEDAAEICPTEACPRAAEANNLVDRGKTSALIANIAYGVGAAAIVGAGIVWFTGGHPTSSEVTARRDSPMIVPAVSRSFLGMQVSITY
jgi:tetratricopeptide (TPR) repeat protein